MGELLTKLLQFLFGWLRPIPKAPKKRLEAPKHPPVITDGDPTPREIPPPTRPGDEIVPPPELPDPYFGMRGKALFVRNYKALHRDPIEAAQRYFDWGFDWACVPILWADGRRTNRNVQFWTALDVMELPHWPMVYIDPKNWRDQIAESVMWAKDRGSVGIVLDVEREFRAPFLDDHLAVAEHVAKTTQMMCHDHGLRCGFTSFGSVWNFSDFPWEQFARYSDIAINQAYDAMVSGTPGFIQRSIDAYAAKGFEHIIVGGGLWNRKAKRSKSASELSVYLDSVPPTPGICCWGAQRPPTFQLQLLHDFELPRVAL